MANTERKARKASGEKFVRAAKVGTPLFERQIPEVQDRSGRSRGVLRNHPSNRARTAQNKLAKFLGIEAPEPEVAVKKTRSRKAAAK